MKKYFIIICVLFIIAGCSTQGEIKITNNTSHYLFITYGGTSYVLDWAANNSKIITIDTGKKFIFQSNDDKVVDLGLQGETFAMFNSDFEEVITTKVTVKPNETTNIYTNPTHACVKLFNHSQNDIVKFDYITDVVFIPILGLDEVIEPGDSLYYRLQPSEPENIISYSFEYLLEGSSDYIEINDINDLYVDEVYPIIVSD